jgi:hypothetical protein
LFKCSGGTAPVITEEIQVQPQHIVIPFRMERSRAGELDQKVDALLKRVREGLGPIEYKLKFFNPDLRKQAAERIRLRQNDLASHSRMVGELRKSRFRVIRVGGEVERVIIPVKPKTITILPRPASTNSEPELSMGDYDEILAVIQSMAMVYERSPSAFAEMEEESLRTILLVGLNGVFKGDATGETFNGDGKSDILIRVADLNIFIAECLFWDGPEKFRKKLTDQLFRYSTWRDSKLAAIVFNRKKGFSAVVQKIKEVVMGLEDRVAEMPYAISTGCRHRFRRADDPQKHFILTCLAFEVPS